MREYRLNWVLRCYIILTFSIYYPTRYLLHFPARCFVGSSKQQTGSVGNPAKLSRALNFQRPAGLLGRWTIISKHHLQSWPSVQYCPGDTLRFGCCTLQGLPVGICLNHAPLWFVVTIYSAVTVIALGRVRRRKTFGMDKF